MPWYYNTSSGELTHQTGTLAEITGWINTHTPGLGWHQLRVPDSATEAQAAADARKEFPHATPPTTSTGQAIKNQVSSETGIPLTGLAAIGDFFQRLTQASTWERVAQVVLGFGLIIVGLAHLVAETPVGRTAARVGKAAALL